MSNEIFIKLIEQAKACNGIVDCTGQEVLVRQVLGQLQLTADGCVVGANSDLWYVLPCGSATETVCMTHTPYMEPHQPCYSSKHSAETALRNKDNS